MKYDRWPSHFSVDGVQPRNPINNFLVFQLSVTCDLGVLNQYSQIALFYIILVLLLLFYYYLMAREDTFCRVCVPHHHCRPNNNWRMCTYMNEEEGGLSEIWVVWKEREMHIRQSLSPDSCMCTHVNYYLVGSRGREIFQLFIQFFVSQSEDQYSLFSSENTGYSLQLIKPS